jgi:arginyl-tRNA synthetase
MGTLYIRYQVVYNTLMINDQIQSIVQQALVKCFDLNDVEPSISYPEPQFGEFATNVAFGLAKRLQMAPAEIAQRLSQAIDDERVEEATATGGFINISMTVAFWIEQLHAITPRYGAHNQGEGRQLQVEFISANPTGPLTIGNARGGFIGDVLSRVLEHAGYRVTREYYFNDAGTQIRKLVESVRSASGQKVEGEVQYSGEYIQELAQDYKEELQRDSDAQLGERLTRAILERYIRPAVAKMGIKFEVWFNERDLINDGMLDEAIERLRGLGLVYERDGAVWLDSAKLGLEREARVLVKSNGDPTYLAPDIAYHLNIFERRQFDAAIKVLGPDHIDQFPSVKAAINALCHHKELTMASYQWLRVIRDGKEVKVSKRLGQFITIEELIEEVGMPVARFLTLMRAPESHMDFDLDLAKERSQKNPYYYLMYSYARANSILEQARERGLTPISTISALSAQEQALIRQMSRFPELIQEVIDDYGVHRLIFFGLELAQRFHDLYESERIIKLDRAQASRRLYVIERYTVFMRLYWGLLGITPQEKMIHQPDDISS